MTTSSSWAAIRCLAVQLIERLRRLKLQIEVRTLFATPVLSDLATTLSHTAKFRSHRT